MEQTGITFGSISLFLCFQSEGCLPLLQKLVSFRCWPNQQPTSPRCHLYMTTNCFRRGKTADELRLKLDRWPSSGLQRRVDWYKFTNVSEVLTASIIKAMTMEAVQTSETFVNSNQSTRRYNPEDGHLRTHRRENLKA
jgi:hypothetical protein